MELFYWLVIAHYLADFPLQGDFIAANKGKRWYLLAAHCAIWTGIVSMPLALLGGWAWWKIAMLFVGHYLCDRWKARQANGPWHLIYFDQAFHGLQLLACLF